MERPADGVPVETDMSVHWRMQKLRKIAFVVGILLLGGAVAGVFGSGPLSSVEIRDAGFTVEYERFGRVQRPMTMTAELAGKPELWISQDYLSRVILEHVTPEPSAVQVDGPWVVYKFGENATVVVRFTIEPQRPGKVAGWIRGPNGRDYLLSHWIYP